MHQLNDIWLITLCTVSVAYKFHVERGAGPREAIDYWKDHLTSVRIYKICAYMLCSTIDYRA